MPGFSTRLPLTAVLVALASVTTGAQGPSWTVSSGAVVVVCPMTVGGSFEARTSALSGALSPDPNQAGRLAGEIAVELATLDTGIGLRNTHLRDNYLEVGRGEAYRRAVLKDITLGGDVGTLSGATTFTGTLLVHGVERPVRGQARLARQAGVVRVDARFEVMLPDHDIAKPRYLGVGVRDQVQVRVQFQAVSAGQAESGR